MRVIASRCVLLNGCAMQSTNERASTSCTMPFTNPIAVSSTQTDSNIAYSKTQTTAAIIRHTAIRHLSDSEVLCSMHQHLLCVSLSQHICTMAEGLSFRRVSAIMASPQHELNHRCDMSHHHEWYLLWARSSWTRCASKSCIADLHMNRQSVLSLASISI